MKIDKHVKILKMQTMTNVETLKTHEHMTCETNVNMMSHANNVKILKIIKHIDTTINKYESTHTCTCVSHINSDLFTCFPQY
jgi:hypothetical protein